VVQGFMDAHGKRSKTRHAHVEAEEDTCFSEYQQLKCSICMSIFQDPARCPCGHTFCRKCIEHWVSSHKTCPEDRTKVLKGDLHDDFLVGEIISRIAVACPQKGDGCTWKGKLHRLQGHIARCKHNPANKPSWLVEHEGTQASPVIQSIEDVDVEYLEQARDGTSPPPMSLAMRLMSKDKTNATMLQGLFTHKVAEMNQDIMRATSGDSQATTLSDDDKSDAEMSEDGAEEEELSPDRAQALADIGNRLETIKNTKASKGRSAKGGRGYKRSSNTGRWVKC